MRNENFKKEINSGWELFKFCLKYKVFDLLLILMVGLVWYGQILLKITVAGKDSTMMLLAIYVWPILIGAFSLVMFGGMLFFARNVKKSISALFVFLLIMILIPILMIISPLSRLDYSSWF
ncbi:MAG: hypothetical protein PHI66_04865 [Candidatus Pacebacteria bacterium]|nr:hypothetical protein [Candidatus Paceibacterota bacterium]